MFQRNIIEIIQAKDINVDNLTMDDLDLMIGKARDKFVKFNGKGRALGHTAETFGLFFGSLVTLGLLLAVVGQGEDDSLTLGEKYRADKVESRVKKAKELSIDENTNTINPQKFIAKLLEGEGEENLISFKYYLCNELTGINATKDQEAKALINHCRFVVSPAIETNCRPAPTKRSSISDSQL